MIEDKLHKSELLVLLIAIAIGGFGIYYLGPSITGFLTKEFSYTEQPNLVIASSGNYTWHLENIGDLKYVKLDGRVTNYGKARVYIESNGIRYLVFDSTKLNESKNNASSNIITGFAVKVSQSDNEKKNNNKKPEWTGPDQFIINGTTIINLSQYFTDKDNDSLIYSASQVDGIAVSTNNEIVTITPISNNNFNTTITFTASDGIDSKSHIVGLIVNLDENANQTPASNETINITQINESINITPVLNASQNEINQTINETTINKTILTKTIAINLSYKSGTVYDANDNGEESIYGIVDLTVENTKFGWDAEQSRLCTRWEVYSIEDEKLTTLCNGNADCCAFAGLLPSKSSWNEIYYSAFGKDGAGHSNIVSSQVIYYDANLSGSSPKSEIYNSEWSNLSVKFFDEETQFSDICLDTCSLTGLNKSSYNLVFEIEDDAILMIDKIKYSVLQNVRNNAPLLLQNFSTINVSKNQNATINLSQYFSDIDGDVLSYDYYKVGNLTIIFENDTATIVPDKDFEGTRFTYITANDSDSSVVSNVFGINVLAANYTPTILPYFEIRDKDDKKLAVFDSQGNAKIKGNLTQNTEPTADGNDFVIQNQTNGLNLVVTNPEGNMMIKGSLNSNQGILIPTPDSFVIQNRDNEVVAYVNSTGNLFLKGSLTENVQFG